MTPILQFLPISELSPEDAKQSYKIAERQNPELWKKCYPRTYEPYKSGEYPPPRCVAHQMMASTLKINGGLVGQSETHEIMWASKMAQHRTPQYWVNRDLAEAIMQTTPPMKLDWYHMDLPFPAMSFILPHGFLTHKDEGDITFISFARFLINEDIPTLANVGPGRYASENGAMLFLANYDGKFFTHWNLPFGHFPEIDLANVDAMTRSFDDYEHTSCFLISPTMTKEDTRIGSVVVHLIFGLLLLMNRKPEILTKATLLNRVKGKKGEAPREFWTPNVLGMNYKLKRAVPVSLGGTHASPRYHWVRGFWREHRYGPKLSLVKEQWIEPYERGLED